MTAGLGNGQAPTDPRTGWRLPRHGMMPTVEHLDDLATRVLAPNASHMTLDGTNTYIVGEAGSGDAIIVDPGPDDLVHRGRVEAALSDRDAQCAWILVTHHHQDHAEAAVAWGAAFGCRVASATSATSGRGGRLLIDGDAIHVGALRVDTVATPGHCSDHLAFRLPNGAVLTGDHVLGRGTSVVAWPEGDLLAYLGSLRRMLDLGERPLYPGHGPAMTEDPTAVLRFYLEHRAFRERQLVTALSVHPMNVDELVQLIYADVDKILWPAAGLSTRAGLEKLVRQHVVVEDDAERFQLIADPREVNPLS